MICVKKLSVYFNVDNINVVVFFMKNLNIIGFMILIFKNLVINKIKFFELL